MNVFTTDHPLVAQPSCFDAKENPLLSYLARVILAAFILCPLLLGVAWLALASGESPEVPEPAWTDVFVVAVGFVTCLPVLAIVHFADPLLLENRFCIYGGVVLNAIFWAFVGVSLCRLVAWLFRAHRRREEETARSARSQFPLLTDRSGP